VVVPERLAYPLGTLDTEQGALVEPIAVGLHAVRKARFGPDQSAGRVRCRPDRSGHDPLPSFRT